MSTKTVKIVDPRIEPQPDPVYAVPVGPKQNQYYSIPHSGLSNSYITFNNLTTLGADRAYLDTFELDITVDITFELNAFGPHFDTWTFDSWPFNKCCDQVRVNINGGAFFSQPLSYIRAKERYWDEKAISDSYGNVCPCHKPILQNETGLMPDMHRSNWVSMYEARQRATQVNWGHLALPTRTGNSCTAFAPTASGGFSYGNMSIVEPYTMADGTTTTTKTIRVNWREPIFASPFSSRIDATWGRPLYNITSMDIAFNMQSLENMIRVVGEEVNNYKVDLADIRLCYQVMTIPPSMKPPAATIVPYRRIVPYVTDYPNDIPTVPNATKVSLTSGVYTLNEVPTAIWIFAAPTKANLETHKADGYVDPDNTQELTKYFGHNKLFAFLEHLSISCANTTQILNTATQHDLYRIAKANGCQDNFVSWAKHQPFVPRATGLMSGSLLASETTPPYVSALAGSVLRLIPGVDIVLPEQDLIPGSNANNMVFQVTADFVFPPAYLNFRKYSLWLLFEYVGVAKITPGQCEINMNPLGDGKSTSSAPVVSATPTEETSPATLEGSGWWDKIKNAVKAANSIAKKTGIVSNLLQYVPGVGSQLSTAAKSMGYGKIRPGGPLNRKDVEGGAVMGLGDFC